MLHRALTHRSYRNEYSDVVEDNERLEFLGDAVLDFVAAAWLYRRFPEMAEGQLTRLRAALVRTEQLAQFAADSCVGASLLLGKGEEDSGGRERASILCATFEAILGALYVDGGLDPVVVLMEPLLGTAAEKILRRQSDVDARSLLQEWAQATLGQTPSYRTIREDGPDHAKVFTVQVNIGQESYGVGAGRSKQVAAQSAAEDALRNAGLA
ncbi:MAG: ribonuclease III [Chloroflexi bacterium]|nr:ribonuclease III [Chloroflexota bacterium]